MQDMKPQEPDPHSSPESWLGGGPGMGSLGTMEPRAQAQGHSLATAPRWAQTLWVPRRWPLAGLWQAKDWGRVSALPSKPEEPNQVQFRPLPWSPILIRAWQREVSGPQPGLAP